MVLLSRLQLRRFSGLQHIKALKGHKCGFSELKFDIKLCPALGFPKRKRRALLENKCKFVTGNCIKILVAHPARASSHGCHFFLLSSVDIFFIQIGPTVVEF